MNRQENNNSSNINPDQRRNPSRKNPSGEIANEKLEPKPEEKDPSKESGFMKIFKKVGYSVWIVVMVVGASLAFIAALFLI